MRKIFVAALFIVLIATSSFADEFDEVNLVKLPAPTKTGGMSLAEAVTNRHSGREFAEVDLTLQELSDLLYMTAGINRPNGLRVHPVAMAIQDTTVYVFDSDGVYKYNPLSHSLSLVAEGDHRQETGKQEFVGRAAVNLAYVHDINLWEGSKAPKELIKQWGFAHTGAAMQNAYLFAASKGWNAVVRGSFDAENLAGLMQLEDGQSITLIQSIGPKP